MLESESSYLQAMRALIDLGQSAEATLASIYSGGTEDWDGSQESQAKRTAKVVREAINNLTGGDFIGWLRVEGMGEAADALMAWYGGRWNAGARTIEVLLDPEREKNFGPTFPEYADASQGFEDAIYTIEHAMDMLEVIK